MKAAQTSFWFYVFVSVLSVGIFGWYEIYHSGDGTELASTMEEEAVKRLDEANQALQKLAPSSEDMTCNCQFSGAEPNTLAFETPESCGEDRNYLSGALKAFEKLDPNGYYTGTRDHVENSKILPRKCAVFVMRRFWKDRSLTPAQKREADIAYNRTALPTLRRPIKDLKGYSSDARLFGKCEQNSNGKPARHGVKPCVTEEYVNIVYNSLIDVADCMNIPAKHVIPKLANESGMHINAYGPKGDGGINQFVEGALKDIALNFPRFKEIEMSEKESCKRLASIPGAIPKSAKEVLSSDSKRCHVMAAPPNPIRSLVYYGVFYHAMKEYSASFYDQGRDSKDPNFQSVAALLKKANTKKIAVDDEEVKKIMMMMSYNLGPARPVSFFRNWLSYKIANKSPLTKEDFNMTFDATAAVRGKPVGESRAKAITGGKRTLKLAEYVYAYKNSFYASAVKSEGNLLNNRMGAGTCAEAKYLEL
ncbi:MAG: hypothetical protein AAGB31_15135 [Bdellovibrio sp.]